MSIESLYCVSVTAQEFIEASKEFALAREQ
jgi:hypothetical protein